MRFANRAITGTLLRAALESEEEHRQPLIAGLLYENSILMIAADPGAGKSMLTACAMAQASSGLPVFGFLKVPKPLRFYYIPSERGLSEIKERLRVIKEYIPINYDYIVLDEDMIGMDVTRDADADAIIARIKSQALPPDVIILDPIYGFVKGGLSKDEKASEFCRFSAQLQKEFSCSLWMNHHTVKQSYANDGKAVEKSDPFYGSQWLKAHVTGSFYMSKTPNGCKLENKKDSHGNLHELMEFNFDDETNLLTAVNIESEDSIQSKLLNFILSRKAANLPFTFKDACAVTKGVCLRTVRRMLVTPQISTLFTKVKSNGGKTLYTFESD
jgi:RecA-family ATPase